MTLRTKKAAASDVDLDAALSEPEPPNTSKKRPAAKKPSWRGVKKRGGGYAHLVEPPPEFRGTSAQVCGLWPWAAGGSAPTTGVPIGHHMLSKTTVCCDPISWFADAKLLSNPSAFVLGLPGLGKSTFVRRMEIGLAGAGVTPMTLGDTKPDHVDTTLQLGGQVVEIGRGRGSINVLDLGALDAAAQRLTGKAAHALREDAHGRRLNMVIALVALIRQAPVTDTEKAVLSAALRVLADRHSPDNPALLTDLVTLLDTPPDIVRTPTLDRGDSSVYRGVVDPLQRTVIALLEGPLGSVFAQPTTTRLELDAPAICVDVSSLAGHDQELEAAVLLATWAEGYGTIEAANALADAGLAPQRRFMVVLDELWRVLRGAPGMVDRIDALTRLNRAKGVGQIMITHTLSDLRALPLEEDRAKARGFVERAGMIVMGGLPAQELAEVTEIVRLSEAEKSLVTSWSSPPSLSKSSEPPGRGNFLLKIGGRPGIPVHLDLTKAELDAGIHDTNQRWHEKAPAATVTPIPAAKEQLVLPDPLPVPVCETEPVPDPASKEPASGAARPDPAGSDWAMALAELSADNAPSVESPATNMDLTESGPEDPIASNLLSQQSAAFAALDALAPRDKQPSAPLPTPESGPADHVPDRADRPHAQPNPGRANPHGRRPPDGLLGKYASALDALTAAPTTHPVHPDVDTTRVDPDPITLTNGGQAPPTTTEVTSTEDRGGFIADLAAGSDSLDDVAAAFAAMDAVGEAHIESPILESDGPLVNESRVDLAPNTVDDAPGCDDEELNGDSFVDDVPVIRNDTPVARFTLDDVLANPELFEDRQPAATIDLTEAEAEAEPVMAQPPVAGGLTGLLGLTMAASPSPRPLVAPEPVGQTGTVSEPVLEVQAVSIPQARTAELTVPQMSTNRVAARRLRRKPSQPAPTLAKPSGRTLGDLTGKGGEIT